MSVVREIARAVSSRTASLPHSATVERESGKWINSHSVDRFHSSLILQSVDIVNFEETSRRSRHTLGEEQARGFLSFSVPSEIRTPTFCQMRGLADILSDSSGFCQAVQAQDIRQAASIAARLVATTSHSNSPRHKTPEVPYSSDPGDVYGLQEDMLALEEIIPWACVRKIWKNKRSSWRREVRQTSSIRGFAKLLKELRHAQLMGGDLNFVNSEHFTLKNAWKTQLENCISGTARPSTLDGIWLEFKSNVHAWLTSVTAEAHQERMMAAQSSGLVTSDTVGGAGRDTVAPRLIVRLMERHDGNLLHVPVESMMGSFPAVRLAAVRDVLLKKGSSGKDDGKEDGKQGGKEGEDAAKETKEQDVCMGLLPADSFDSGLSTDDEALTDVDDVFDMLL